MIFVSVGTLDRPFNRLVEGVDNIADKVGDQVVIQKGHSTYVPGKCDYFDFCDYEEMLAYINDSDLVISHSGFGIIGNAIKANKPIILVPREYEYGEAVDNQYELAEYIARQNESVICLRDVTLLQESILKIRNVSINYHYYTFIPELIEKFISESFYDEV